MQVPRRRIRAIDPVTVSQLVPDEVTHARRVSSIEDRLTTHDPGALEFVEVHASLSPHLRNLAHAISEACSVGYGDVVVDRAAGGVREVDEAPTIRLSMCR